MAHQVKIRIHRSWEVQNRLKLLGASFLGAWKEKDTYFLQPAGSFLKIKEARGNFFLVKLRKSGETAFTKELRLLKRPESKEKELREKFGVANVVEKRVRLYKYGESALSIHSIPDLGDFLIIEGSSADTKTILRKLGLEKPEFVSLAFSEML